jgi:hypothetical protein
MSTAVTHETLRAMIAALDGYIERKATELAAERIGTADDAASDRVAAVVHDLNRRLDASEQARQRAEDLAQELGRRIGPLNRQAERSNEARDRLARALGRHPMAFTLPELVAEAEPVIVRAREPLLSDTERWQIEEARDVLARWARLLLSFVDQLAPKDGPRG